MNKLSHSILPLIIFSVAAFFCGCESSSTEPVEQGNVDDAYRELENQMYIMATSTIDSLGDLDQVNFIYANTLYRGAVSGNPGSTVANFGASFTEILSIYSDPTVKSMLKQWEQSFKDGSFSPAPPHPAIPSGTRDMSVPIEALAKNTVNIIQAAILDPPLIGEMQNMVRNGILPHIDYALAHFAIVEQDTAFEFPISGKMQGDIHQNPVYLDNTEVYIMDGMLRGLKAIAEQFLVYKFELPVYTAPALAEALQSSNTTFFYRASDGVVRSQSVLADVTSMIGKFKSAINYLKSETDNQSDDIIKIAQQGINGPSVAELDTMLANLDRAADALTTTQTVRLINADTDYHNYTMLVNISAFYNNPPQNPKTAWLPAYTVDTTADGDDVVWNWQAQTYEEFNFPDSTFSGLFEGITNEYTSGTNMNENLKRILHIDEEFPQN